MSQQYQRLKSNWPDAGVKNEKGAVGTRSPGHQQAHTCAGRHAHCEVPSSCRWGCQADRTPRCVLNLRYIADHNLGDVRTSAFPRSHHLQSLRGSMLMAPPAFMETCPLLGHLPSPWLTSQFSSAAPAGDVATACGGRTWHSRERKSFPHSNAGLEFKALIPTPLPQSTLTLHCP